MFGAALSSVSVELFEAAALDGAGLEEMFLELTSDTQREGAVA